MRSIQLSQLHSMVPLENTPIRSAKSFRGRSMQSSPFRERPQHINTHLSNSIKVNTQKFPLGFFTKTKNKGKLSTQYPRVKWNKSVRKSSACMLDRDTYKEKLPEAQTTSFFKNPKQRSDTFDTNLSGNENEGLNSENILAVSDQKQINIKNFSSSAGCNNKEACGNELCLTFSKIPPSTSSFRISRYHDKTMKGEVQSDDKNSNKLRRPLTKLETRDFGFEKAQNEDQNNFRKKLELLETNSARVSRNIDLFLPKISIKKI